MRNYTRYRYTVVATDRVGHRSRKGSASAVPKPELLAPPNGAVLTSPPLLRWSKVRGADYYNVQLLRDGRKVLSGWPTRARLQLKRRWRFEGRVRRMRPGDLRVERLARVRTAEEGELRVADRQGPDVRHPWSTPSAVRSSTGSSNEHEP